jgi:hypothetical protein
MTGPKRIFGFPVQKKISNPLGRSLRLEIEEI